MASQLNTTSWFPFYFCLVYLKFLVLQNILIPYGTNFWNFHFVWHSVSFAFDIFASFERSVLFLKCYFLGTNPVALRNVYSVVEQFCYEMLNCGTSLYKYKVERIDEMTYNWQFLNVPIQKKTAESRLTVRTF